MRRALFTLHRVTAVTLMGVGGGITGGCAMLVVAGMPPVPGPMGAGVLMLAAGMAALLAESLWRHTAALTRLRRQIRDALAAGEKSTAAVRRILSEGGAA